MISIVQMINRIGQGQLRSLIMINVQLNYLNNYFQFNIWIVYPTNFIFPSVYPLPTSETVPNYKALWNMFCIYWWHVKASWKDHTNCRRRKGRNIYWLHGAGKKKNLISKAGTLYILKIHVHVGVIIK